MRATTHEIIAMIRDINDHIDKLEAAVDIPFYNYHFMQLRNFLAAIREELIIKRGM